MSLDKFYLMNSRKFQVWILDNSLLDTASIIFAIYFWFQTNSNLFLDTDKKLTKELKDSTKMEEDSENDPLDYADPVIVKVPLKTPDDALDYWNRRLETVSIKMTWNKLERI